jgi:ABC-type sugar transport system ATPase subunit
MSHGHIEQVGTQRDLYHSAADLYVARFLGSEAMTFFRQRSKA